MDELEELAGAGAWMTRWSYVEVSVRTFETARLLIVFWLAPWNSAG